MKSQQTIQSHNITFEQADNHQENTIRKHNGAILSNLTSPNHQMLYLEAIGDIHKKIWLLIQRKQLQMDKNDLLLKQTELDIYLANLDWDSKHAENLQNFTDDIKAENQSILTTIKIFSEKDNERLKEFKAIKHMIKDNKWDWDLANNHLQKMILLEANLTGKSENEVLSEYIEKIQKKALAKNIDFPISFWQWIIETDRTIN